MIRQKLRKILIFISLLLFPITLNFFSPILIIEGAAKGFIVGSPLVFLSMFLLSLFLGRAWCGWLCPGAGLQEACYAVNNNPTKGANYDLIKYFLWVPWVFCIITFFYLSGGVKEIKPLYRIEQGISVLDIKAYIAYYFFVGLIVILVLSAGRRAFCHYLCWMAPFMIIGTKLKNSFAWPSLKLKASSAHCTKCKVCNKNCPMGLDVLQMVQQESLNHSECILCGACVDLCPNKIIFWQFTPGNENHRI